MSIGFEIVLIALLILGNGVFAMSEMAVITARKSRLQDWVNKGNSRARVALELAQAPNQLLSSVQIGITLIEYPHRHICRPRRGRMDGRVYQRASNRWNLSSGSWFGFGRSHHYLLFLGHRRIGAQAAGHAPSGIHRHLGRSAAAFVCLAIGADGALVERFNRSGLPPFRSDAIAGAAGDRGGNQKPGAARSRGRNFPRGGGGYGSSRAPSRR